MRLEYKYLVSNHALDDLRRALQVYVEADAYARIRKNHSYRVRSIYLDTTGLRYYHEKLAGLKFRKKIRIRGYNQETADGSVFLEVKRKHENYVNKSRARIRFSDLEPFFDAAEFEPFVLSDNPRDGSQQFLYYVTVHNLKPMVLVVYDREAYYTKFNSNLRITIDKNLRFFGFPAFNELYEEERLQRTLDGYSILELKFSRGFPPWLQAIVSNFNLARQAISKYTICLDAQKSLFPETRRTMLPFSRAFSASYYSDSV